MNCETARQRLLEADLAELQGGGELAQHLQSCQRCRRQAEAILEMYAALRSTLDHQAPRLNLSDKPWQRAIAQTPSRRRWAVVVPLALAASLAVFVLARRQQPGLGPETSPRTVAARGPGLDVQGPSGQTVAVFQTDDPNIVVIWSF